jgi:hypothetical protein
MENQEMFTLKEVIFLVIGGIGIFLYRVLGWVMPKTYNIFFEHIKKILTADVLIELQKVKRETHGIKNELKLTLRAILDKDEDAQELIREFYAEKTKQ